MSRTLQMAIEAAFAPHEECPLCGATNGHRLSCPKIGVVPVLDLTPNPVLKELPVSESSKATIDPITAVIRRDYDLPYLQKRFEAAMERIFHMLNVDVDAIFADMDKHYGNSRRYYHGWAHIHTMLDALDAVNRTSAGRLSTDDTAIITLAIFFHDVIIEAGAADNEEKSAEFFVHALGSLVYSTAVSAKVGGIQSMILATKHVGNERDFLTKIFLDLDLWGLGTVDFDLFYDTTARIRAEFSHVEDMAFLRGRVTWLKSMMSRKGPIFYNPMGLNLLLAAESAAMTNIGTERQKLEEVISEMDYLNKYMPASKS